ncbi:MAG: Hpt domain-containing protein [Acidobacteriota bacterium]
MDSLQTTPLSDDLSALAWVHEELRKSLDSAHKALNRCLKESAATGYSDLDALDPAILRTARQQIHQGVGALELSGLTAGATLLRASEALVQKFVNRPQSITEDAVRDIERASFALLDYISRRLAGKPVPALAMFPQYEALSARIGNAMARPIDLWSQDWPSVSLESPLQPPEAVQARLADAATISEFESGLLMLMRNQLGQGGKLAELCAALAADASARKAHRESATWMLASGFLEALSTSRIPLSVHAKRVLSSLLSQLRVLAKGQAVPSDRLAHELLFFCAQAGDAPSAPNSVLANVRKTFGLERHVPVDLSASTLGRYDPAWVTQAIKRVSGAKDGWSAVAAGELLRLGGLNEQFALVADSLRRLYPDGEVLAEALTQAVAQTVQSAQGPEASLAMEVATSLLYLEASLEDGEFDHPDQQQRVRRLAERIASVSKGQAAQPLESWMEDLYRRVSDRQTIGSVVQELRTTLAEAEKLIDEYFRHPAERAPLVNVPSHLQSMKGVLAVLGLGLAAQAVTRMREDVEHLLVSDSTVDQSAEAGVFDRLATNLGALGFLIDMMGVQPTLAKSLFEFNAETGVLSPVMGREKLPPAELEDPVEAVAQHVQQVQLEEAQSVAENVVESLQRDDVCLTEVSENLQKLVDNQAVQEQSELADSLAVAQAALETAKTSSNEESAAAAREQVAQVLADFAQSVTDPVGLDEPEAPVFPPQAPLAPAPVVASAPTGLEEDDEMREIFLEEAREVITDALAAVGQLDAQPADVGSLTAVRRAFHTLKGSSRMVGLKEFGEAGWACEQMYNAWLASHDPASLDLLAVTRELLGHFANWTEAIAEKRDAAWTAAPVIRVADALRLNGERLALALDVAEPAPVVEEAAEAPVVAEAQPPVAEVAESVDSAPEAAPDVLVLDLAEEVMEPAAPVSEPLQLSDFDVVEVAEPTEVVEPEAIELDLREDVSSVPDQPESTDQEPLIEEVLDDGAEVIEAIEPVPPAPQHVQTLLESIDLDLPTLDDVPAGESAESQEASPALDLLAEPKEEAPQPEPEVPAAESTDEQVKVVGHLRISIPLFNIYLNESDEQSRRLQTNLSEWALELHRPISDDAIALAHSLAGNSATVGYLELSGLARLLEHSLMRSQALGAGELAAAELFNEAAEEVRRLLHQFAAGFLKGPSEDLMRRLEDYDQDASRRLEARILVADQEPEEEFTPVAEVVTSEMGALDLESLSASEPEPEPETAPESVEVEAAEALESVEPAALEAPTEAAEPLVDIPLFDEPAEIAVVQAEAAPEPEVAEPAQEPEQEPEHVTQPAPLGLPEFKALTPLAHAGEATRVATVGAGIDRRWVDDEDIDAEDNVDVDLFPIFEEEAQELLPELSAQMRQWIAAPNQHAGATACLRTLHTFKGGARLAGAMRLGEMAHRLESSIERMLSKDHIEPSEVEPLEGRVDALVEVFEALRRRDAQSYDEQVSIPLEPTQPPVAVHELLAPSVEVPATFEPEPVAPESVSAEASADTAEPAPGEAAGSVPEPTRAINWSALPQISTGVVVRQVRDAQQSNQAAVRVRPQLLDRLVNHAGEVSITRTRLAAQVGNIRGSLNDLTENLDRLRLQLRDIEFQAETQLSTRMEAARAASQEFDPLEFDRYTRFQELTRMMAESVNDVHTVQRTLLRSLETAEDQIAAQARLTRDLQDDLLRTRMVEFEGLSDRLYRVVRQAAKETGKQVRLDILGGSTEVDRGVLERMTGSFEHLLRNCVTHGIESPEQRVGAGKEAAGTIVVALRQEGNEVSIEFRDDGAGLNLERIRQKGLKMGFLQPDAKPTEAELAQLIFTPGFSTADTVTELAGRGIGMDVVRSEVNAMGGRIETGTSEGKGTSFTLVLPLTTAVTKVVMLRCGQVNIAVPTHLIEMVRRAKPAEVEKAYETATYTFGDMVLPFYWLGALLQLSPRGVEQGRSLPVVIVRSAQQRVALHVDEVLGNQEVVVKNLGPQLSRLPGLAGMTLLASGAVSLIYNPVALATVYGERAHAFTAESLAAQSQQTADAGQATPLAPQEPAEILPPLVMVVDDSLTVRKVTQRLLSREGYRVVLAKDGLEALEILAGESPTVVLSDIEMPRMDGFDLLRNIRSDARLAQLPVIMITSRIAQKHKDYAEELGANHYLGKPYGEEELLALVARYAAAQSVSHNQSVEG